MPAIVYTDLDLLTLSALAGWLGVAPTKARVWADRHQLWSGPPGMRRVLLRDAIQALREDALGAESRRPARQVQDDEVLVAMPVLEAS